MARRGMLNASPRERVLSAGSLYGSATSSLRGSLASGPKVRLWALVDPETYHGRLIAYRPSGNLLERHDLGAITTLTVTRSRTGPANWTIDLESGERVSVVSAKCVCGAGKVGYAGPVDGPHTIESARTSQLEWWVA